MAFHGVMVWLGMCSGVCIGLCIAVRQIYHVLYLSQLLSLYVVLRCQVMFQLCNLLCRDVNLVAHILYSAIRFGTLASILAWIYRIIT